MTISDEGRLVVNRLVSNKPQRSGESGHDKGRNRRNETVVLVYNFDDPKQKEWADSRAIGPKEEVTHRFVKPVAADLARMKSDHERIILVGKMSYRDVWKTEYTSTFEGSLVEINGLVTACETYNPKTGPLMVGPVKFLWWRPDDKQTNQKI